jgi:chromate transporter
MTTDTTGYSVPQTSLPGLFWRFLRFGCLAFGGPVVQIAMLKQALVEEERWITPARFNKLLAVMQVLPGPEAHELCVHFGMLARGRIGGLLAGLGFMLPGFVLMLAAAWAYQGWIAGSADAASALLGVQIVVVAIIARAVQRIGAHVIEDKFLWGIAVASFVMTMAGVPFWIPLLAAGLAYAAGERRMLVVAICAAALVLAIASRFMPDARIATASAAQVTTLALFIAGLKGGLLTFGGAYTAIPYVRADTVGRGWLSDGSFLDGVALAGVLPAPLVIFATFAGYVVGGWTGAFAITAGMFLPAFAFSMILFERLETLVEHPALHHLLTGIAAAVVGVIAATCLQLGWATANRSASYLVAGVIFVAALAAVWRIKGKFVAPVLIALGGLAGWALGIAP